MQLRHRSHESSAAHHVDWCVQGHHIERPVVDRIKLALSVRVANVLEKGANLASRLWSREIIFVDSNLGMRGREKQIHGLRLVAVVLIICN